MSRMYKNVRTWNPAVGCSFNCVYCAFKRTVKRVGHMINCDSCKQFVPHEHPERLNRIPSATVLWPFAHGDIYWYNRSFVEEVLMKLQTKLLNNKIGKLYLQSKNPICFKDYMYLLEPYAEKIYLLTTLETNRNIDISAAPFSVTRYKDFANLIWDNKIVTIEPVMDFDLDTFTEWVLAINPSKVYLGFNSRPNMVQLPEPSPEKFIALYERLNDHTEVILKETKGLLS